jgi:hypothetical protein
VKIWLTPLQQVVGWTRAGERGEVKERKGVVERDENNK